MDDRQLMQQALDALELCNGAETAEGVVIYTDQEVAALRERLAQPEQEIDWKDQYEKQKRRAEMWRDKYEAIAGPDECVYPAQPEQEPVACPYCHNSATLGSVYYDQNCVGCVKRMTTPPRRKPLTWERVLEIGLECANDRSRLPFEVKVARAIEAAHGIKGDT